jgi:catechol 2,3-dioxygenase-like lactoylglutathione lyase family enzyme
MISGAHIAIFSKDAEADRAFFRDVLGFSSVDAGHGWLIFALPGGGQVGLYQPKHPTAFGIEMTAI